MPRPRYVFGEAWSIARSSPRQTAAAMTLIALALFVPGLLALVSRNLGRLAVTEADPTSVVITLAPGSDARQVAARLSPIPASSSSGSSAATPRSSASGGHTPTSARRSRT